MIIDVHYGISVSMLSDLFLCSFFVRKLLLSLGYDEDRSTDGSELHFVPPSPVHSQQGRICSYMSHFSIIHYNNKPFYSLKYKC